MTKQKTDVRNRLVLENETLRLTYGASMKTPDNGGQHALPPDEKTGWDT